MDERLESLQTGQIDCYATGICRADVCWWWGYE